MKGRPWTAHEGRRGRESRGTVRLGGDTHLDRKGKRIQSFREEDMQESGQKGLRLRLQGEGGGGIGLDSKVRKALTSWGGDSRKRKGKKRVKVPVFGIKSASRGKCP